MDIAKVAFCGEKPLALKCLQFLQSLADVEIICVCTRAQADVWWGEQSLAKYCRQNNLKIVPCSKLGHYEYDYLISVLYPFIIKPEHIYRSKKTALNLHEAPLPRWRGCNGYSHAIINGDICYGTTLHVLDPVLDAGEIIAMKQFVIMPDETAKELYQRTNRLSLDLFQKLIPKIFAGNFSLTPASTSEESFLHSRNSLMPYKELSCGMTMKKVYLYARSLDFVPWEPAYYCHQNQKYYFYIGDSLGRDQNFLTKIAATNYCQCLRELDLYPGIHARVMDFHRPLIVCDEKLYNSLYQVRN